MRYLSVCSGIEVASIGWKHLGWAPVAFAEVDAFASAVLAHHYPDVPNLGDFTKIGRDDVGAVDLLVGGTPCQDFSVAGLRAGLAGDRGRLTIEYLRLAQRLRPRWLVWENVPGVLSADEGRAFGIFLGLLGELGYGFAYRVLDAQHFGVPQRRRRVFVVGHLGDWRRAAAVLFERESLSGDPAPRRRAREDVTGCLAARPYTGRAGDGGGGLGTDFECDGGLVADTITGTNQRHVDQSTTLIGFSPTEEQGHGIVDGAPPITRSKGGPPAVAFSPASATNAGSSPVYTDGTTPTLRSGDGSNSVPAVVAFTTQQEPKVSEDGTAFTVTADSPTGGGQRQCVAFSSKDSGADALEDLAPTLRSMNEVDGNQNGGGQIAVAHVATSAVRRLTPRECERLQGVPDDYTLVPDPRRGGKLAADQPRYHALGNAFAAPVVRWIGERIAFVETLP